MELQDLFSDPELRPYALMLIEQENSPRGIRMIRIWKQDGHWSGEYRWESEAGHVYTTTECAFTLKQLLQYLTGNYGSPIP